MIVNLAELRQQRTLPPQPELDPAHPRRRNPLLLEQQKSERRIFCVPCDQITGTRLPVFTATRLTVPPGRGAHNCMMHSK
jgi:hypothetical protein